jgi:hypothetical protein
MIQVHSLPSLQQITQVPKSKGCLFYVEDRSGGVLRLCAALKRKALLLLHWNGKEFTEFKVLFCHHFLIIYDTKKNCNNEYFLWQRN